jgi:chorismate mutase
MKAIPFVLAVMTLCTLDPSAGTKEQLEKCRQQIDSLDQRIVDLIQQRARVVEEVGKIKRKAHLPVTVPSREQQVIEKAQDLAKGGPLPADAVGRIYEKLVEECVVGKPSSMRQRGNSRPTLSYRLLNSALVERFFA